MFIDVRGAGSEMVITGRWNFCFEDIKRDYPEFAEPEVLHIRQGIAEIYVAM